MSAADRSKLQSQLGQRTKILDDVRRVGVHKWLAYANAQSLPSDPGRCSTEALELARTALLPSATPKGGDMALKSGKGQPVAKKAAPAKAEKEAEQGKMFLVRFPATKPQKATAVVLEGDEPVAEDGTTQVAVGSVTDLEGMPMPALLALANIGNTGTPIRKVSNEESARVMAWDALTTKVEVTDATKDKQPKVRAVKLVSFPSKDKTEIKQVRTGTKVATAVDLLGAEGGVLLSEFEAALSQTGKPISGRAWLGYDVAKVVGYGVRSEVEGDDLRLFLVLPKGMKAPLAHKTVEEKPAKEPKPEVKGPASKKAPAPVVEAEAAPVAKAKKAAKAK